MLWLLLAAAECVLLLNDAHLDIRFYLATQKFLQAHPAPVLWAFFKLLGNPWIVAVLVCCMFIPHKTIRAATVRERPCGSGGGGGTAPVASSRSRLRTPLRVHLTQALAAIVGTALAGGIGGLIAIIAGRFRPLADAANNWVLFRGFHIGAKNLSFPSGHATLAFAAAAILCYFYPKSKWIALLLAAGCAFSRVAHQAHFYSDVIFGAVLGWTVAWWTAHVIHAKFATMIK